jgi:hypothetical protein
MITSIYIDPKSRTSYTTAIPSILSILSTLTLIISLLQSRQQVQMSEEESRLKNLFHIHLWPFLIYGIGGSFLAVETVSMEYIESLGSIVRGSVTPVLLCAGRHAIQGETGRYCISGGYQIDSWGCTAL